jgi:phosphoglycolate phosphatase-like HAD superfamily hydrolase
MTCNIKCCNTEFNNIEAVLIDVSGTLVDYNELWLKQIGYLSQVLAENHASIQGELFRIRAMIMKALGVDPETCDIDYSSSLFTSETNEIKAVLSNILYLNKVNWVEACEAVNYTLETLEDEIDFAPYTKIYPNSIEFLDYLSGKTKLITYSKRSYENSQKILDHHKISDKVFKHYSMYDLCKENKGFFNCCFASNICDDLQIKSENTLLIADSIYDLCFMEKKSFNRVIMNRNSIDNYFINKFNIKYILSSLKEIEVS